MRRTEEGRDWSHRAAVPGNLAGFARFVETKSADGKKAVNEYRIYPVGLDGHIAGLPRRIAAEGDKQALSSVKQLLNSGNDTVELWRGTRYVATLTRNPNSRHSDLIIVVSA